MKYPDVKVIAIDADDTLWENEPRFREAERKVGEVLSEYIDFPTMSAELYAIEVKNMPDYGYGAMAFTLSMLETATKVSHGKVTGDQVRSIIEIGRELLHNPATPLEGVEETLKALHDSGRYTLICLTKGDLLDQTSKAQRSGLLKYFDRIEVVANKTEKEYSQLIDELGIPASQLMTIGNSFKSDIAPVLKLGGHGIHIPFHIIWELEKTEEFDHHRLTRISTFSQLKDLLL